MKINDRLYGFTVTDEREIREIGGTVYLMNHDRSGATLCFLDRPDPCKTFAITFNTVPEDDTGVFHILEHSVLCGSDKFPVKEPFTELLKCSLNTFLNALTYSDRTSYPLSSRCDRDFLNMMDVYLDAVFHPRAVREERIFRQEGWRYELDDDGRLCYNGVVYNEMKGAYSSPDELASYHAGRLLFPGSPYAYDSGGKPDAIPSLSFEEFCAMHEKYYHPSECFVFLDGSVKLNEALPLIDGYLSEFEKREPVARIELGGEPITEPCHIEYEIAEGDDPKDKTRVVLAYRAYDYTEREKNLALSILADALADGNTAPLKASVLSTGLVENLYFYPSTSSKYGSFTVELRGIKDGRTEEAVAAFHTALTEVIERGIPEELLTASLSAFEFRAREADFDSYPKGIIYLMSVFNSIPYGGHPADSLSYDAAFSHLRERLGSDYFVGLLREIFIGTPEVKIIMTPSATLGKRRDGELCRRLSGVLEQMSDTEREELSESCRDFALWQATPDTPEALATIPRLTLDDLSDTPPEIPNTVTRDGATTLLVHKIPTGGISYVEAYFDASDVPAEDIPLLVLLDRLLGEVDTEDMTANELATLIKSHSGGITLAPRPVKCHGRAKLYLVVRLSVLATEWEWGARLFDSFIYKTRLDSPEVIRRRLNQLRTATEEALTVAGSNYALMRCAARYDSMEYLKELTTGYELHSRLKKAIAGADEGIDELIRKLCLYRDRIFTRERLTLGITDTDGAEALSRSLLDAVRTGGDYTDTHIDLTLPRINEGIAIPSPVSYAVLGSNLCELGESYRGSFSTLASILNYSILWNAIRVEGGAYGAGFIARSNSGTVGCYSYRDPSPGASLEVYRQVGKRIREFLADSPDLTGFIIGSVGSSDALTTPRTDGAYATLTYLSGKEQSEAVRIRREMIATTHEELLRLSELLDRLAESATVAVVGSREELLKLGLDRILSL